MDDLNKSLANDTVEQVPLMFGGIAKHQRIVPDLDRLGGLIVCLVKSDLKLIRLGRFDDDQRPVLAFVSTSGSFGNCNLCIASAGLTNTAIRFARWNDLLQDLELLRDESFGR